MSHCPRTAPRAVSCKRTSLSWPWSEFHWGSSFWQIRKASRAIIHSGQLIKCASAEVTLGKPADDAVCASKCSENDNPPFGLSGQHFMIKTLGLSHKLLKSAAIRIRLQITAEQQKIRNTRISIGINCTSTEMAQGETPLWCSIYFRSQGEWQSLLYCNIAKLCQ